jgi:fibronectin-binding autotransporter adhesin
MSLRILPRISLPLGAMLALVCLSIFHPRAAWAETKIWDGGGGNNLWSTAANWQPDGVPGAGDDVVIDVVGAITVQVNFAQVAATVNCAETLQITSGSLTIGGSSTIANLAVLGGTLGGAGNVSVSGSFAWTNGTMGGAGQMIVQAGATMNLAGGANQRVLGRELLIQSNGTLSGTGAFFFNGGVLRVAPAAALAVDGPVTFNLSNGSPSVHVEGTLTKTGVGTLSIASGIATQCTGAIDIQQGTVQIGGTLTHSGTCSIAEGGLLTLNGLGQVLEIGSTVTGAAVTCAGANVVSNGTVDVDALSISSGTMTLNGSTDVGTCTLSGGTLSGSADVLVSSVLNWTAGTMAGNGRTLLTQRASGNLDGGFSQRVLTRQLEIQGSALLAGTGAFFFGTGGQLRVVPGATLTVSGTVTIAFSAGSPSFVVEGNLLKTNAGTFTVSSGVSSQIAGSASIDGVIHLAGSGSHTGSFSIASGSTLRLGANQTLEASSSVAGGTLELNGTPIQVNASVDVDQLLVSAGVSTVAGPTEATEMRITGGTLTLNDSVTVATLVNSGGSLVGSGNVVVADAFTWTAGTLGGSGTLSVQPGATLQLDGGASQRILARAVSLGASGTLAGSGAIFVNSGTLTIAPTSTLTVSGPVQFALSSGTASIIVDGTIVKQGSGTFTISSGVNLFNNGLMSIATGAVHILGGGTHIGDFLLAGEASLRIGGNQVLEASSSVTGGSLDLSGSGAILNGPVDVDLLLVSGGTPVVNGAADTNALSITAGTLTLNAPVGLSTLSMTGGAINGSGTITVDGSFTWTSGSTGGSGTTVVAPGTTMNLASGASQRTLARTLDIQASGTLSGSGAFFIANGTLKVGPQATLTVDGPTNFFVSQTPASIIVSGVWQRSGSGTCQIGSGLTFQNDGLVDVTGGILSLSSSGTHSGDFSIASDAKLTFAVGANTLLARPAR